MRRGVHVARFAHRCLGVRQGMKQFAFIPAPIRGVENGHSGKQMPAFGIAFFRGIDQNRQALAAMRHEVERHFVEEPLHAQ